MPSIDDADQVADQFEAMLARRRIDIATGSRLESALLFVRHVQHVRDGSGDIGTHDDRPQWREMLGVFDLARRLLTAESETPDKFEALRPWLKLFASVPGQLAQTAPATVGDQASDKVFELLVALCLLPKIDQLVPDRGRGDNPDLLFRFESRLWGVACKRLYSTKPATFRDTVCKAIAQIESSSAEQGVVIVSVVNLVRHDDFYPLAPDGTYTAMSREAMEQMLAAERKRLADETVGLTDLDLGRAFVGKKAMPGVIHYIATSYLTGSPEAVQLKSVQQAWSRGIVNEMLQVFQHGLNSTSSTR